MYILKNVTVITMDDYRILYNTDVFIANGKICRMGHHIGGAGIREIDCTGKYLIPGLIDCHIHMDSNEITEMLLANGVTACRNMWGCDLTQGWIREINEGKRLGPKVYTTGPLTDGVEYWEGSYLVTTPEEGEKAVIECIKKGYDYFKTYPSIPRDAFKKIMDTAENLGIKVVGHGNYHVTCKELIDWGYYSLEHCACLPENSEDIIMLAESDMWFCPTIVVNDSIDRYVYRGLPLETTKNYDSMCSYWHKDWQKITDWRKSLHRYDNLDFEAELDRARLFVKHSDHVVLGTDTPNPGVTGGFSVFEEMDFMRDIFNMSPYQILRTATVNAAKCLGVPGRKGMLKEGMDADILILDKDPLEDIDNTDSFLAVIKEGEVFERSFLKEHLEKVKHYTDEQIQGWM